MSAYLALSQVALHVSFSRFSTYENLHSALAGTHLLDQGVESCQDLGGALVVPDVVGAEMHHDDVGLRLGQPTNELVLLGNVGGKVSAVSFIFAVVGKPASLRRQRSDKVDVRESCILELSPQQCPPTALKGGRSAFRFHRTGQFQRRMAYRAARDRISQWHDLGLPLSSNNLWLQSGQREEPEGFEGYHV